MKSFTKPQRIMASHDFGWGNGYVVLDKGHSLHGKAFQDIDNIDIHGGLTFGTIVTEAMANDDDWPLDESDIGKYVVGFDTAHYRDNASNCNKEYVESETKSLMNQLGALK